MSRKTLRKVFKRLDASIAEGWRKAVALAVALLGLAASLYALVTAVPGT